MTGEQQNNLPRPGEGENDVTFYIGRQGPIVRKHKDAKGSTAHHASGATSAPEGVADPELWDQPPRKPSFRPSAGQHNPREPRRQAYGLEDPEEPDDSGLGSGYRGPEDQRPLQGGPGEVPDSLEDRPAGQVADEKFPQDNEGPEPEDWQNQNFERSWGNPSYQQSAISRHKDRQGSTEHHRSGARQQPTDDSGLRSEQVVSAVKEAGGVTIPGQAGHSYTFAVNDDNTVQVTTHKPDGSTGESQQQSLAGALGQKGFNLDDVEQGLNDPDDSGEPDPGEGLEPPKDEEAREMATDPGTQTPGAMAYQASKVADQIGYDLEDEGMDPDSPEFAEAQWEGVLDNEDVLDQVGAYLQEQGLDFEADEDAYTEAEDKIWGQMEVYIKEGKDPDEASDDDVPQDFSGGPADPDDQTGQTHEEEGGGERGATPDELPDEEDGGGGYNFSEAGLEVDMANEMDNAFDNALDQVAEQYGGRIDAGEIDDFAGSLEDAFWDRVSEEMPVGDPDVPLPEQLGEQRMRKLEQHVQNYAREAARQQADPDNPSTDEGPEELDPDPASSQQNERRRGQRPSGPQEVSEPVDWQNQNYEG